MDYGTSQSDSINSSLSTKFDVLQTLKVNNDLLACHNTEISEDILFPDELNKLLSEKIQYFTYENAMLKKNLEDLEFQYNKCNSQLKDLEVKLKTYEKDEERSVMLTSNEVIGNKIVELTKRLREKTSEAEMLKTKCSKLGKKLFEMNNTSNCDCSKETLEKSEEKPPTEELEEENKKLRERIASLTNKLGEIRNSNQQLKNDLKLANKWLQQETGDTFASLHSLNSTGKWRGRAQIICDLQRKNSELKEKIKNCQDPTHQCQTSVESVAKINTKTTLLSQENDDLRRQCSEAKRKNEGLKARCKVFDNEIAMLKSKLAIFEQQSERDQEIISTFMTQISNFKNFNTETVTQKDRSIKRLESEKDELAKQIQEYKNTVTTLKEELKSKAKLIDETKPSLDNKPEEKVGQLPNIQPLLSLIEEQTERLRQEREAHFKTQNLLKIEKQKAVKAAAMADFDSLKSYSSMSLKQEPNLKHQLELAEENIKALKTRLEIEEIERKADLEGFSKVLSSFQENSDK